MGALDCSAMGAVQTCTKASNDEFAVTESEDACKRDLTDTLNGEAQVKANAKAKIKAWQQREARRILNMVDASGPYKERPDEKVHRERPKLQRQATGGLRPDVKVVDYSSPEENEEYN